MPHLPDFDRSDDEVQELFSSLDSRSDVAHLLNVPLRFLTSVLYGPPGVESFYKTWEIKKKSGGTRSISAPSSSLYILQSRLNQALQAIYLPRKCVQGFVVDRSHVTNAWPHVGKKWVFNCDLADFFPSLNFGRVRGVFMAKPFDVGEEAATTMAQIATVYGALPIGGPASPVISNMIAMKLDGELMRLARRTSSWYTRYADDLTFSSNKPVFPSEICIIDQDSGATTIGAELFEVITSNGFAIQPEKTRLQGRDVRQVVTGIVVNERTNVDRRYVRKIRAMLHSLETLGEDGAQQKFEALDTKDRYPGASPDFLNVLDGKIAYLSMVRGADDPLVIKTRKQYENLLEGRPRRDGLEQLEASPALPGDDHVFISYVREDSAKVDRLQADLEAEDFTIWRDVKDIWPGELWKKKIRDAIEHGALAFVPCFSESSVSRKKSYMYHELRLAGDEYRQRNPEVPWIFPRFSIRLSRRT